MPATDHFFLELLGKDSEAQRATSCAEFIGGRMSALRAEIMREDEASWGILEAMVKSVSWPRGLCCLHPDLHVQVRKVATPAGEEGE